MPQDLPGFYYDAEKNRYFPIKGPIPGSNRSSSSSATSSKPESKPSQPNNIIRRTRFKTAKLLQDREVYGNVIISGEGKYNFQEEYRKRQASQPLVWKYKETDRTCDGPLEQIHVDKQTTGGLMETSVLLTSSINCTLSLLEVGRVGQPFEYAIECMAEPMWPLNIETRTESWNTPEHIWRPIGSSVFTPSVVSSMKVFGKHVFQIGQDVSTSRQALYPS